MAGAVYDLPLSSTRVLDWICTTYADPAQPLTTAGEELDGLNKIDHDQDVTFFSGLFTAIRPYTVRFF